MHLKLNHTLYNTYYGWFDNRVEITLITRATCGRPSLGFGLLSVYVCERRALERRIVEGFQVSEYQVQGVLAPSRKIYNLLQIVTSPESCSIQLIEVAKENNAAVGEL